MKWLLTNTLGGDRYPRYEAWLRELSIRADRVSPGERLPGLDKYAALLLTGGGDVDPDLYVEPRQPETKGVNRRRDEMEKDLIQAFLSMGKPVFGVCRGIQVLNVALRGKLLQHVPAWLEDRGQPEPHTESADKRDGVHALRLVEGTRLARALEGVTEVNSAHHQAVDPDALGNDLVVSAFSGSGIVEAVEGVNSRAPILAVQWHPERLPWSHPASSKLLRLMRELASG